MWRCTSSALDGPGSAADHRGPINQHVIGRGPAGRPDGTVARLAARIAALTAEVNALQREITTQVRVLAPSLLAVPGVAGLTAAKIVAETAGADRFKSKDAYARHNGTAPLPAWSGNPSRHRLSRTGNRQLTCAIHRIAITQKRFHPAAQDYLQRRTTSGDTPHRGTARPQTAPIRHRLPGAPGRQRNRATRPGSLT
jgi:transposase